MHRLSNCQLPLECPCLCKFATILGSWVVSHHLDRVRLLSRHGIPTRVLASTCWVLWHLHWIGLCTSIARGCSPSTPVKVCTPVSHHQGGAYRTVLVPLWCTLMGPLEIRGGVVWRTEWTVPGRNSQRSGPKRNAEGLRRDPRSHVFSQGGWHREESGWNLPSTVLEGIDPRTKRFSEDSPGGVGPGFVACRGGRPTGCRHRPGSPLFDRNRGNITIAVEDSRPKLKAFVLCADRSGRSRSVVASLCTVSRRGRFVPPNIPPSSISGVEGSVPDLERHILSFTTAYPLRCLSCWSRIPHHVSSTRVARASVAINNSKPHHLHVAIEAVQAHPSIQQGDDKDTRRTVRSDRSEEREGRKVQRSTRRRDRKVEWTRTKNCIRSDRLQTKSSIFLPEAWKIRTRHRSCWRTQRKRTSTPRPSRCTTS